MMKTYKVGGCVRDLIMGVEPKDTDWVVVGSSESDMLQDGFKCVGKRFPVFLHPESGDEYALARKEYSTGDGNCDFDFEVSNITLEEDLYRRDFTMNAIAMAEDGTFTDPYGGIADIENKVLDPVSYHFTEDPLRVIRAARFLARYPDLVATPKLRLYCSIMADKVFDLPKDRLWKEMSRALEETQPSRFFEFLEQFGLMPEHSMMKFVEERNNHHPEDNVFDHTMQAVDIAAWFDRKEVVLCTAVHDFGKIESYSKYGKGHGHENMGFAFLNSFLSRWGVPNRIAETCRLVNKFHSVIHQSTGRNGQALLTPKKVANLFGCLQCKHNSARLLVLLATCTADAKGRGKTFDEKMAFRTKMYNQPDYILRCLDAYLALDTKAVAEKAKATRNETAYILEKIKLAVGGALKHTRRTYKEPVLDTEEVCEELKLRLTRITNV